MLRVDHGRSLRLAVHMTRSRRCRIDSHNTGLSDILTLLLYPLLPTHHESNPSLEDSPHNFHLALIPRRIEKNITPWQKHPTHKFMPFTPTFADNLLRVREAKHNMRRAIRLVDMGDLSSLQTPSAIMTMVSEQIKHGETATHSPVVGIDSPSVPPPPDTSPSPSTTPHQYTPPSHSPPTPTPPFPLPPTRS